MCVESALNLPAWLAGSNVLVAVVAGSSGASPPREAMRTHAAAAAASCTGGCGAKWLATQQLAWPAAARGGNAMLLEVSA